jgi:transposase-like protein
LQNYKGDDVSKKKLDEIGIDAICARIAATESQRAIARSLGVDDTTMWQWLNATPERAARARAARELSAYTCDELALDALHSIPDDATPAMIARQREIASHQRWRAKTRNKQFSDKVTAEHAGSVAVAVTAIERVIVDTANSDSDETTD